MEIIPKGTNFIEFLYKIDGIGAIQRKIEYRDHHNLPQVYDVYTQEKDRSFKHRVEKLDIEEDM